MLRYMYMYRIVVLLLALPLYVSAHGSGVSIERQVGEYLVDIGYSPSPIEELAEVRFDFSLRRLDGSHEEPFDRIWVRIEGGGRTFFASGIAKAEFGPTTLLFRFSQAGEHVLSVRYENNGEIVTELKEIFVVVPSEERKISSWYVVGCAVVTIFFATGFLAGRYWPKLKRAGTAAH